MLQPGVQFQLEVSRSASDSLAHYRSTLDVRFVDEEGRVLWVDALILYLNSVRWSEVEDVRPFLQSALREALRKLAIAIWEVRCLSADAGTLVRWQRIEALVAIDHTRGNQVIALKWLLYDGHGNLVRTMAPDYALSGFQWRGVWGEVQGVLGAGRGYCANLGHPEDETGLVYMRARYYEPATGRFISEDPDAIWRELVPVCGWESSE